MAESGKRRCVRSHAWRRARWREHMVAQGESGLPVSAYCRAHGLRRESFYRWRRVFRAEEQGKVAGTARDGSHGSSADACTSAPAGFAELLLASGTESAGSSGIELVLPGERMLRLGPGFDEETLRRVLSVLESLSC